jgi:gliding motility-associated-like protein
LSYKFFISLGLLALLSFAKINAQIVWLHNDGGSFSDESLDIKTTSNGDATYCGYFNQGATFGAQTPTHVGLSDAFVAKRNGFGVLQWVRSGGGSSPDRANAIEVGSDGSVVVTGYYTGSANFSGTTITANSNSQDIFVAKYSATGSLLWIISLGGNQADAGLGIDIDNSGNIAVTGQFGGVASFGSYSVSSMWNPDESEFSLDIFVCKISSTGTVLWAKSGSAPQNDRPADVQFDNSGNVHLTGHFSNNITFGNTYFNGVENVGFLMKLDPDGNDLWLKRITSTYIVFEDLSFAGNGDMILSGSFKGQLVVLDSGMPSYLSDYEYNFFVIRMTASGAVIWLSQDGSDNYMAGYNTAEDADGNIYITGVFDCIFDEYNTALGGYQFVSAGYSDVFITKLNSTGQRQWMRQYGGPGREQCQAIAANVNDTPLIAGGFEIWFNVPVENPFPYTNYADENTAQTANYPTIEYCGDGVFGQFAGIASEGNRDSFIARPYNANAAPYNFVEIEDGIICGNELPELCLGGCEDTLRVCADPGDYIPLDVSTRTGSSMIIGPTYVFEFGGPSFIETAGGDNEFPSYQVDQSGTYWITSTRLDGCSFTQTDSIYVEILYNPEQPVIADNLGLSQNCTAVFFCEEIHVCSPIVTLNVEEPQPNVIYTWTSQTDTLYGDNIDLFDDALWHVTAESADGCVLGDDLTVYFHDNGQGDDHFGYLQILQEGVPFLNDSIFLCPDSPLELGYFDVFTNNSYINGVGAYWDCPDCTIGSAYTYQDLTNDVMTDFEGWYEAYAWFNYPNTNCPSHQDSIEFYVEYFDTPSLLLDISGPDDFCPGDLITLTASGSNNYTWTGPGVANIETQSIQVNTSGYYYVNSTIITDDGCSFDDSDLFIYPEPPSPVITSNPSNGIVCPGQEVILSAPLNAMYQWIGPEGTIVSDQQHYSTSVPGDYQVVVTDNNGCESVSGFLDIELYTSPFLYATPYDFFCTEDPIIITIETNEESSILWLPPLSGSALQQEVVDVGVYTVVVTLCQISDTLGIEIFESPVDATITADTESNFCLGDVLAATSIDGMQQYVWQPGNQTTQSINITQPGTYQVTAIDADGCIGTSQSLIVAFDDIAEPSVDGTTICSGYTTVLYASSELPVYWMNDNLDVIVQSATLYTETLYDETIYYLYSNEGNCFSDTIQVAVEIYPVIEFEIDEYEHCLHEPAVFNVLTAGVTFAQWSMGDGNYYAENSFSHTYAFPGLYSVVLSGSTIDGCVQSVIEEIEILPLPISSFELGSYSSCSPLSFSTMNQSLGAESYVWQFGDGDQTSQQEPDHEYFNNACDSVIYEITLIAIDGNACRDTVRQNVVVYPNPQVYFELSDSTSCYFPANPQTINNTYCAELWQWNLDGDNVSPDENTLIQVNDLGLHEIQLIAKNNFACVDSASRTFEIYPLPQADFGISEDLVCPGDTLFLENNSQGAISYEWILEGSPVFLQDQDAFIYYDYGSYDVGLIATTENNCKDTLTFADMFTIRVPPFASFTMSDSIVSMYTPEFVFTDTSPDAVSTLWLIDNWQSYQSEVVNYSHNDLGLFPVWMQIWDINGCTDTILRYALVEEPFTLYVPNAITSNDDALNEYFLPKATGIDRLVEYELTIYDRWGSLVFKTNNPLQGWVANMQGGDHYVQNDVYVWRIKYRTSVEADGEELNGTVTVIR